MTEPALKKLRVNPTTPPRTRGAAVPASPMETDNIQVPDWYDGDPDEYLHIQAMKKEGNKAAKDYLAGLLVAWRSWTSCLCSVVPFGADATSAFKGNIALHSVVTIGAGVTKGVLHQIFNFLTIQ